MTTALEDNRGRPAAGELTSAVRYTPGITDEIIELYLTNTLTEISRIDGMPTYQQLFSWMHKNPEFREKIYAARKLKALQAEERALEVAEAVEDKDDVPAARLKFDANVWQAKVSDPETYGNRTTVAGDSERPLTIVLSTGVPPPTPDQEPPELGEDGRVIPRAVKEVTSEVVEPGESPESEGEHAAETSGSDE